MEINWRPEAINALREVYLFHAENDERAADKIFNAILGVVDQLSAFPEMAPVEQQLTGLSDVYRSVVVHKLFKVVYVVDKHAERVVIISVWDCRQDPETLKKKVTKKQ